MDVAGSVMALTLSLPLFLIIAILIKLTSKGPVFFRQDRVGCRGSRFVMLKFRSMYADSDARLHEAHVERLIGQAVPASKLSDDPRVTPVGRLLRRTSLDELPQFLNVLAGSMSLVGPRPPIPYEVSRYDDWHMERLLAKPGITGPWQVSGRSRVSFDDMVRLDIDYVRSRSAWLDVKILFRTVGAVVSGRGAS
jgi:lipopolysaccharide/colanic/teichoic acid biosynthesis glycosyltransferase